MRNVIANRETIDIRNQELAKKAKRGNKKAISDLLVLNRGFIYNVLLFKTKGNSELSEDLTQDVLVKIISNIRNYEDNGFKFRTWISKIVSSSYIDHIRKEKTRAEGYSTSIINYVVDDEDKELDIFNSGCLMGESVEHDYINSETNEFMKKAIVSSIESLSNIMQKRAIVLHLFEDLSYNEISDKLGVSLDTTKSLIYRAKQGILKNIVKNNSHVINGNRCQLIVQDNIVNGVSTKQLSKKYKIKISEVEKILSSGLNQVYRYKFYEEVLSV